MVEDPTCDLPVLVVAECRDLLAQIGVKPDDVRPPDIDETPHRGELPRAYARRIAEQKSRAVALDGGEVLLCADTTVALGRRILGKPEDAKQAAEFLTALSGRRHRVITGISSASSSSGKTSQT